MMPPTFNAARNGSVGRCICVISVGYQYVIEWYMNRNAPIRIGSVERRHQQSGLKSRTSDWRVALLVRLQVTLAFRARPGSHDAAHDEEHEERPAGCQSTASPSSRMSVVWLTSG